MQKTAFSFREHWDAWEKAASRIELADKFCSSPFWGIPLVKAFHRQESLVVYQDDSSLAIFNEIEVEGGSLTLPCDIMWTLGSPVLAADPAAFLGDLCSFWLENRRALRQVTVGGPYVNNPIWSSYVWLQHASWSTPGSVRQVASLEGGPDGFLSRRSPNFRSRLKRAVRKAKRLGVETEFWPHAPSKDDSLKLFERAMLVEKASWKGLAGQGVDRGQMREFYRCMIPLLAARGMLRGLFLKRDGQDLSYLLGARFADGFRGLQFSYLEDEHDSLGNIGQWEMIGHLCQEGCLTYDLGQAMAYKSRWAENKISSRTMSFQLE